VPGWFAPACPAHSDLGPSMYLPHGKCPHCQGPVDGLSGHRAVTTNLARRHEIDGVYEWSCKSSRACRCGQCDRTGSNKRARTQFSNSAVSVPSSSAKRSVPSQCAWNSYRKVPKNDRRVSSAVSFSPARAHWIEAKLCREVSSGVVDDIAKKTRMQ